MQPYWKKFFFVFALVALCWGLVYLTAQFTQEKTQAYVPTRVESEPGLAQDPQISEEDSAEPIQSKKL